MANFRDILLTAFIILLLGVIGFGWLSFRMARLSEATEQAVQSLNREAQETVKRVTDLEKRLPPKTE